MKRGDPLRAPAYKWLDAAVVSGFNIEFIDTDPRAFPPVGGYGQSTVFSGTTMLRDQAFNDANYSFWRGVSQTRGAVDGSYSDGYLTVEADHYSGLPQWPVFPPRVIVIGTQGDFFFHHDDLGGEDETRLSDFYDQIAALKTTHIDSRGASLAITGGKHLFTMLAGVPIAIVGEGGFGPDEFLFTYDPLATAAAGGDVLQIVLTNAPGSLAGLYNSYGYYNEYPTGTSPPAPTGTTLDVVVEPGGSEFASYLYTDNAAADAAAISACLASGRFTRHRLVVIYNDDAVAQMPTPTPAMADGSQFTSTFGLHPDSRSYTTDVTDVPGVVSLITSEIAALWP